VLGLLIRLALFGVVIYVVYRTLRMFKNKLKGGVFGAAAPFAKAELCPSCRAAIRVPEEPGHCPKCATLLGRTPDGKLLIKVN
jgi:predicted amidophosphoribosyltransferase